MKKKLLTIVVCLAMVGMLMPQGVCVSVTASGSCGDNVMWSLSSDGVLTLSGTGDVTSTPWQQYADSIKSAVIGEAVTSGRASSIFSECVALENISVLGDNPEFCEIDGNLFSKDGSELIQYAVGNSRRTYTVPDGVVVIGGEAFKYCESLEKVVLPDGITRVESYAFYKCTALEQINMPQGVTSLGWGAFGSCTALETMFIPGSIINSLDSVFDGCSALVGFEVANDSEFFKAIDGNLYYVYSGNFDLVKYAEGKRESTFVLPDGVMGLNKFSCCYASFENIVIPDSLMWISDSAFAYGDKLSTVFFRASDASHVTAGGSNDMFENAKKVFNYDGSDGRIEGAYCMYDGGRVYVDAPLEYLTCDAQAMIAVYDADGRLVFSEFVSVAKDGGIKTDFAAPPDWVGLRVKLSVWESEESIKPLSRAVEAYITADIVTDAVLESAHPYENAADKTESYSYDGECKSITVTFSAETLTEKKYDFIYIYDGDGREIGKYSGTELSGVTVTVPGNTVRVRLTSDESYNYYGYRTDKVVVNR